MCSCPPNTLSHQELGGSLSPASGYLQLSVQGAAAGSHCVESVLCTQEFLKHLAVSAGPVPRVLQPTGPTLNSVSLDMNFNQWFSIYINDNR